MHYQLTSFENATSFSHCLFTLFAMIVMAAAFIYKSGCPVIFFFHCKNPNSASCQSYAAMLSFLTICCHHRSYRSLIFGHMTIFNSSTSKASYFFSKYVLYVLLEQINISTSSNGQTHRSNRKCPFVSLEICQRTFQNLFFEDDKRKTI